MARHRAQIADQRVEVVVAKPNPVDVDHRHGKAGGRQAAAASDAGSIRGWVRADDPAHPRGRLRSGWRAAPAGCCRRRWRRSAGRPAGATRPISCRASGRSLTRVERSDRQGRDHSGPRQSHAGLPRPAMPPAAAANRAPGSTTSTSSAIASKLAGQSGEGQPISRARSNRRGMSRSRSRHSSNARSKRNSSGPIRAARSRRRARRWRSNRSGSRPRLCGGGAQATRGDGHRDYSARSDGSESCCWISRCRRAAPAAAR